jgi:hypothetical protein
VSTYQDFKTFGEFDEFWYENVVNKTPTNNVAYNFLEFLITVWRTHELTILAPVNIGC